jgi:hypothetical protein
VCDILAVNAHAHACTRIGVPKIASNLLVHIDGLILGLKHGRALS